MTVIMEKSRLQIEELLARVSAGDEVLITQDGNPIARVEPMHGEPVRQAPRVPGMDAGKLIVPDDIVAPLPDEIIDEFYK
jgi:prevent-host-death family protein